MERERNPSPQNDKRACMCKDGKTYKYGFNNKTNTTKVFYSKS